MKKLIKRGQNPLTHSLIHSPTVILLGEGALETTVFLASRDVSSSDHLAAVHWTQLTRCLIQPDISLGGEPEP